LWGVQDSDIRDLNLFHFTIALFALKNDDEIARMKTVIRESMKEIPRPEDRSLTFSGLNVFGRPAQAKILYAEGSGAFKDSLERFVDCLATNVRTAGFTRMCLGTPLHAMLLLPHHVYGKGATVFDGRPMVNGFTADTLPAIECCQLRLVKRFRFDRDKSYHTEARFPVYDLYNEYDRYGADDESDESDGQDPSGR
jgi:hypothetical protein